MTGPAEILLADDDTSLRRVVEYQLSEAGYAVTSCASAEDALQALDDRAVALLLTDLMMPGMSGLELLDRLQAQRSEAAVIVITGHGDVATAVKAMQAGAVDFLEKPFSADRLLVAVERALEIVDLKDENRRLRAMVDGHGAFEGILGTSECLQRALGDLARAAATDTPSAQRSTRISSRCPRVTIRMNAPSPGAS